MQQTSSIESCEKQAGTHRGLTHTECPAVFVEANAKKLLQAEQMVGHGLRTSKTSDDESSRLQCQVQWVEIMATPVSF